MKKKNNIFLAIGVAALFFFGCERTGYLIDGGVHETTVDMTTYDYLTTNPIFDTLVMLIDKAGLKETINGDVTFFAPTDFSIRDYLDKNSGNALGMDQFADSVDVDDIPVQSLQDSLLQYVFPGSVNRSDLPENDGEIFPSMMGNDVYLSLEESDQFPYTSRDGSAWWQPYPGTISTWPLYLYYTRIVGLGLDDPDGPNPGVEERDKRVLCQTSGIETTNGVLHVLSNQHTLFFYVQTYFPTGI